jgi:hypothetical protein
VACAENGASRGGNHCLSPDHGIRARARHLNSVSAADPVQIPLLLLFLELDGYYVNAVQIHVHAADVLVRCGIHREGIR